MVLLLSEKALEIIQEESRMTPSELAARDFQPYDGQGLMEELKVRTPEDTERLRAQVAKMRLPRPSKTYWQRIVRNFR